MDPKADFSLHDRKVVVCSRCYRPVPMRVANQVDRFESHRGGKKCLDGDEVPINPGQTFLSGWLSKAPPGIKISTSRTEVRTLAAEVACPGIGFDNNPRIPPYLRRTVVPSGGAPRREVLTLEVLRQHKQTSGEGDVHALTAKEVKDRVLAAERTQARWLNHHTTGTVTSPFCLRRAQISRTGEICPCAKCLGVLRLKVFRTAIKKRPPKPGRSIHTPKGYRNEVVGASFFRFLDVEVLLTMVSTH